VVSPQVNVMNCLHCSPNIDSGRTAAPCCHLSRPRYERFLPEGVGVGRCGRPGWVWSGDARSAKGTGPADRGGSSRPQIPPRAEAGDPGGLEPERLSRIEGGEAWRLKFLRKTLDDGDLAADLFRSRMHGIVEYDVSYLRTLLPGGVHELVRSLVQLLGREVGAQPGDGSDRK